MKAETLALIIVAGIILDIILVGGALYQVKKKYRKEEKAKVFSISSDVSDCLEPTIDVKVSMMKIL